jgi:hypothetical protein
VLIDVAGLKGVDMPPDKYEITVEDLEQALGGRDQASMRGLEWAATDGPERRIGGRRRPPIEL